jgi:hypothetical protein
VIFAIDAAGDKLFRERIDNDALRFLEVVSAGGASTEVVIERPSLRFTRATTRASTSGDSRTSEPEPPG